MPIAFVAPTLWALESLLDLYFVHDIYFDEWDGTVISGLFMLLPWLLPAFGIVQFNSLPAQSVLLALLGGALYLGAYAFYFRALFRFPDSTLVLLLWETQVLLVPFLAWLWFDERLLPVHYFGIGLAFLGSFVFSAREGLLRRGFLSIAGTMFWGVLLFAASMVVQKEAYRIANQKFFDVFLIFSLGGVLLALAIVLFRPKIALARARRLSQFNSGILALLVIGEIVSGGVILFSQRAIDLSPSVSFVSAIESSTGVFVMLFSLLLALVLGRTRHEKFAALCRRQMLGWREKLFAMSLLSAGIFCIAG